MITLKAETDNNNVTIINKYFKSKLEGQIAYIFNNILYIPSIINIKDKIKLHVLYNNIKANKCVYEIIDLMNDLDTSKLRIKLILLETIIDTNFSDLFNIAIESEVYLSKDIEDKLKYIYGKYLMFNNNNIEYMIIDFDLNSNIIKTNLDVQLIDNKEFKISDKLYTTSISYDDSRRTN